MAKYRKLPVEIEAFQLNSRGLVGEDWFWDAVTRNDIITHSFGKHEPEDAWCEIKTLEGTMIAQSGDYIIRGIKDEIYPCKADIFHATYTQNSADAVIVVRCKDCKWFVPKHIKLPDGTTREYTQEEKELPLGVPGDVGINCGSRCMRYSSWGINRIPVWAQENDFCSYGERKEK